MARDGFQSYSDLKIECLGEYDNTEEKCKDCIWKICCIKKQSDSFLNGLAEIKVDPKTLDDYLQNN